MQRCPDRTCCLAGDSLGNCGFSGGLCQTPVEVNPETDVVVHCKPCGKTIAMNVKDIMSNRCNTGSCPVDPGNCQAQIMDLREKPKAPKAATPKGPPPFQPPAPPPHPVLAPEGSSEDTPKETGQ